MEATSYELNSRLTLNIGQHYSQDDLQHILENLEVIHGGRLRKIFKQSAYLMAIVCRQNNKSHHCPYFLEFQVTPRENGNIYKLKKIDLRHKEGCVDPDEKQFLRNRFDLQSSAPKIIRLVEQKCIRGRFDEPPIQIMRMFEEQQGLEKDYIFNNVEHPDYRRRLKKKFDNIVAQGRQKAKVKRGQNNPPVFQRNIQRRTEQQAVITKPGPEVLELRLDQPILDQIDMMFKAKINMFDHDVFVSNQCWVRFYNDQE